MKTVNRSMRVLSVILVMALMFALGGGFVANGGASLTGTVTAYADPTPGGTSDGSTSTGASNSMFNGILNSNGEVIPATDQGTNNDKQLSGLVNRYQKIASIICGILAVTMFILMLLQFTKLGAAGDNEQARKRALGGILTTGIATALLGSASVVIGFFWNALANMG